jgi:hypothetical protein
MKLKKSVFSQGLRSTSRDDEDILFDQKVTRRSSETQASTKKEQDLSRMSNHDDYRKAGIDRKGATTKASPQPHKQNSDSNLLCLAEEDGEPLAVVSSRRRKDREERSNTRRPKTSAVAPVSSRALAKKPSRRTTVSSTQLPIWGPTLFPCA